MPQYDLTINVIGRDQASSIFSKLSGWLGRTFSIAGGIVAARTFFMLAEQIKDVVAAAINATAQFQNMQIGLEGLVARELSRLTDGARTIAQVFPDAQLKAAGLMDELSRLAIVSPYMVDAVMQTFRMQMAFGFTTDQAMKMTSGLLNMAAGIGATSPMLQRMAYNLAQINLQGKVTALDIRQLALAGLGLVDVLKYVAKEMGYTIETHLDFNELIKEGAITWEDFANLFQKYAEENFAGASERMARTLYGLKSTFQDVFVLTMPKTLGPAIESVTVGLNKILDLFIYMRESGHLEAWGAVLKERVDTLIAPFNDFMDIILKYLKFQSMLSDRTGKNEKLFKSLRVSLKELAPTGDIVYDALEKAFGPKAAEWYVTIRENLAKLVDVFLWMRDVSGRVWRSVGIVLDGLGGFWLRHGESIRRSIGRVVEALLGFGQEEILGGLGSIEEYAEKISDWLWGEGGVRIAGWIEDFADWIVEVGVPKLREFAGWLEEKVPVAMQTLRDFYYNDLKPAWEDFKITWDENIMPGFQNLKQFWDENGDELLTVLGNFALALVGVTTENANENIRGLGESFEEGTRAILDNGPQIVENLKNITDKLVNIVDTITDPQFGASVQNIALLIGTLWAASKIIGIVSALAGLFGWLGPLLFGAGGGAGFLASKLKLLVPVLLGGGAAAGGLAAALPLILIGVIALGIALQPELAKIAEAFGTWMGDLITDFNDFGAETMKSWISGKDEEIDNLYESMGETAQAALDIWVAIISGPVMFILGQDTMQGWWDGFAAKWAEFWEWSKRVIADWIALMATATGSQSPSWKTRRIGQNLGEGLLLGLRDVVPKIEQELSHLDPLGRLGEGVVHEYVTVPVTIGSISSDIDVEAMYQRIAERMRYDRAMQRR